jgi:hypothetical protein
MGRSMELAQRTTPGMAIVPDEGSRAVQWFNVQGSGFAPDLVPELEVNICWTPPNGPASCRLVGTDHYGVTGLGIQIGSRAPLGIWSVTMCQTSWQGRCTSGTFTVLN